MRSLQSRRLFWRSLPVGCLYMLVGTALYCRAQPAPIPAAVETLPRVLTRGEAVRWALQYNPELAAIRQQRGIAAAAVVIAETYPFNPVWEGIVEGNSGPSSAGITNLVAQ
ncbi:MAG TPA: hypothetical protein VGY58_16185, partial [Gemmataceae bacterium]|nr:hypothetical protein [Gemmataceae bacterium]